MRARNAILRFLSRGGSMLACVGQRPLRRRGMVLVSVWRRNSLQRVGSGVWSVRSCVWSLRNLCHPWKRPTLRSVFKGATSGSSGWLVQQIAIGKLYQTLWEMTVVVLSYWTLAWHPMKAMIWKVLFARVLRWRVMRRPAIALILRRRVISNRSWRSF